MSGNPPNYPTLSGIELPLVKVYDPDTIHEIKTKKMSPEAMVELAVYLKRMRARVDELKAYETVIKERIDAYYDKLSKDHRESVRTEAGMVTYSEPKTTESVRDRDETVESLTPEQLRASYKPDIAALRTMLKPDAFARLVETKTADRGTTSVRDTKGGFEEIEGYEDF